MNLFLIWMLVSILLSVGTGIMLFRKRHIAESVILGISWFFCSYVISTMILFLLDVFTMERGIQSTCLMDAVIFVTTALTSEKISMKEFREHLHPEKELRALVIPLLIALLGLPFVGQKNELFGMGQDEGVYQCVAINLMNGYDDRQQDFTEYHLLNSDESRENFQTAVHNKLVGYDIPVDNYPDTVYDRDVSEVSGIYHGIPTYAALLAMWGTAAGVEHMADIQTIFYILSIFLICFVCDNLHLKSGSKLAAALMMALSPVVIWVAKSSLTEMFLAVLTALFLYFLTDKEHPEHYGYSAIPIIAFSCYHVSIYTLMPYVMIVYAGMYFFTKKKTFAGLLLFSVVGYLLSYLIMRHVQPFYTMNNYRFVFNQYINVDNITETVVITSAVLMLLCMFYILIVWNKKQSTSLESFLEDREHRVLTQWLLIGMTAVPLIYILFRAFSDKEAIESASAVTLMGFFMNAGAVLLPCAIFVSLIHPKSFLESEGTLVIFTSFFYCVLIYSALLRFQIEYYYYYARYLVPFIPAAVLFAVTALDKADKNIMLASSAISICMFLPYSGFLINHKDDTRMEWNVLEDITEQIPEDACVVIDTESLPTLWLPVRAITGADVYPSEKDLHEQFRNLSDRYDQIYYLNTKDEAYQLDENLKVLYKNILHRSEDMNLGEFSTMPLEFQASEETIYFYQYLNYQTVYTAEDIADLRLYGIDGYDKSYCWTINESSAVRCVLQKKPYQMTMKLGSNIPLGAIGKERFTIRLSVNGVMTDVKVLTRENNHRELKFKIPEDVLTDGSNIISFHTDMWAASAVNEKDTRIIGIPLESLTFQERKSS